MKKKFSKNKSSVKNIINTKPLAKPKNYPKWFYLILFLLPIFSLIIFELSLRIFNYGKNNREWISINDKFEILNPDISYRYFDNIKNIPFSTESFLLKEKPSNSIRVIALGASSAAGFPFQNSGSFTKYIRKALEFEYPDKRIEVANLSMAAINSYTIRDILPSVVEKNPDAILIYLGHNEYYGAMGAASDGIFGSSRFIKITKLKLLKYKTYEFLTNVISFITKLFIKPTNSNETLMANVAKNKMVEYNSEIYFNGLNQFEENLKDILEMCTSNNIPVIIATVVSNLKDLKPFISIEDKESQSAEIFFKQANDYLNNNNINRADSLFRLAKDFDALRFRAPEKINEIIKKLSNKKNIFLVNIDSLLNFESDGGIIGNDYMVDHLHPNLTGYQKIGKYFYQTLKERKVLAYSPSINYYSEQIDSLVKNNFHFTKYDSIISDYRIKILKNDWPFVNQKVKNKSSRLIKPNSFEGEIALNVLESKLSRYEAREKLLDYYFRNSMFDSFCEETLAFYEEFPIDNKILNEAANKLIKNKKYVFVENLLKKSFNFSPDVFNTKWLGIMYVSQNKFDDAKFYLELSLNFNNRDPQILFNLAGIYYKLNDLSKAYEFINKCLAVSPNYKGAINFKIQLENIMRNK